jgi:cytochrome bd-type quinol oxidase subunit 1
MVAGALSGVGIWLVISVYNPQATSFLIHTFVLAWATEWTCFLVEIASLFLYYYTFDRMAPGKHIFIGWVYFVAAWLSLFFINGIIGFMFTPGAWLQTGNFWDALFNPSFWPSLAFRTFLALTLAGIYGLMTSSWLQDDDLRQSAPPVGTPYGWRLRWFWCCSPAGAISGGAARVAPTIHSRAAHPRYHRFSIPFCI